MDRIANPELLRTAVPDLRAGIPADLFHGSDPGTQQWLLAEHVRQRCDDSREEAEAEGIRARAVRRIVARPSTLAPATVQAQLAELQRLLFEAAATVGRLAQSLPTAEHSDAPGASPDTKEPTP